MVSPINFYVLSALCLFFSMNIICLGVFFLFVSFIISASCSLSSLYLICWLSLFLKRCQLFYYFKYFICSILSSLPDILSIHMLYNFKFFHIFCLFYSFFFLLYLFLFCSFQLTSIQDHYFFLWLCQLYWGNHPKYSFLLEFFF